MIDAGLYSLLTTTSAITTICGTRIYPVVLPTGPTYPAATYKVIAARPDPTFETSGFQRWRIEFNCFGQSFSDAAGLRSALRALLEGYRGTLSDGTLLQDGQFIQIGDDFDDDERIYRCMIEFYLFFNLH